MGFFDGLHENTGADVQGIGDLEKGFQSGLPLAPFDGTEVCAPDPGQSADQLLGHFLFFPDALKRAPDDDGIQHGITSFIMVSVKEILVFYEYICCQLNTNVLYLWYDPGMGQIRKGIIMKRRILALVLILAMLLPCLMGEASAATSGKCGTNATWKFDAATGTLTISGTGKMYNYECYGAPWSDNLANIKKVVIKNGITSIGNNAFVMCWNLTSVSIPSSVTYIGESAFNNCTSLTDITISNSVTTIGESAFYFCASLKTITIPASVTSIGDGAFWLCESLKSITVNSANKNYSSIDGVLFNKKQTKIICYPAKHSGSRYTIPDSVVKVGDGAFWCCTNLTNVVIPDSVRTIGHSAFFECVYLSKVTMGENVETIGNMAFASCGLTDITLPSSVTSIGSSAFYMNPKLKSIIIPEGITTIEPGTFNTCQSLTQVFLPKSVKKIGENAFALNDSITDVYYAGNKKQRQQISVDGGNWDLEEAIWHYNIVSEPSLSIAGNATTGKSVLTWDAVSGADYYRIYRSTSKTGTYKYVKSTRSTSYTDSNTKAGNNYYYKVKTVDKRTGYTSQFSNVVNRVCDLKKPVVTLKTDTSTGKPKLTWKSVSGAEKYYIVRSTSKNGTYTKLATVTGTSYIDKTAKAGVKYFYKVKALHAKDSADSAYSTVVSRVCDLAKPVVTIKLKSGDPQLTWKKVEGATKYYVYRATSKNGEYTRVKTTKTATSFKDTGVKAGKTYYYKVKAVHSNTDANSAYSSVKSIKAK